jgi:hypothetical protein
MFYFTPHKERAAAVAEIDGKEWRFKQEQFESCTLTLAEYKQKKLDWLKSLKESEEFHPGDVRVIYDPDPNTYVSPRLFFNVNNANFTVKEILAEEDWYGPGLSYITADNGMKLTLIERFADDENGVDPSWLVRVDMRGHGYADRTDWNAWLTEQDLHHDSLTPQEFKQKQREWFKSLKDDDSK